MYTSIKDNGTGGLEYEVKSVSNSNSTLKVLESIWNIKEAKNRNRN